VNRFLIPEDWQFTMPRKIIVILLGFQLASTVMELAGLVILLPVFQFVQAEGNVESLIAAHESWRFLTRIYGFLGLPPALETLLASSFCFLLLRQGFVYARLRYQAWALESMIAKVRALGFRGFFYADAAYQDTVEMGSLVNDLTTDLRRGVQYLFAKVSAIGYLILILVYFSGLLMLSLPMTLTAALILGVAVGALRGPIKRSDVSGREVVKANQEMTVFLVERLRHSRLVRLAGMERVETAEMDSLTDRQVGTLVRLFVLLAKIEIVMEPIVIGATFVLIYVSVTMFSMRIEEIGLFLVMVLRLLPVVKEAARTVQSVKAARAAYDAVNARLVDARAARESRGGAIPFTSLDRSIRFENVSFEYESGGDAPALRDINLEIEKGTMTALVGPSGAGKSTLVDLLPIIRIPQSGKILFDSTPIANFQLETLRDGIAYAPQTPEMFNVSLAEHIRYGKADATNDEIERAAELAGATAFIKLQPSGFNTLVGDAGGRLSGGQRQRLDLARALVAQSPILLLDEPTSNLDAQSEALFRAALERIRHDTNITIILIGHRLSSVMTADQIVVLNNGEIVETGTHNSLTGQGGWYASAFESQKHGTISEKKKAG